MAVGVFLHAIKGCVSSEVWPSAFFLHAIKGCVRSEVWPSALFLHAIKGCVESMIEREIYFGVMSGVGG